MAGGGAAALEALLTLSERLAADERELSLIAPNKAFIFRPLSALSEFATHPPHELSLAELAASTNARLLHDRVVLVDDEQGRLLTHDGDWIGFDHLLLATGAHELPLPRDWLRWPPEGDPGMLWQLSEEVRRGELRRLAVVVPTRAAWPLAGYELALILATAAQHGGAPHVSLLTEEQRPLKLLGPAAEGIVRDELRRANVEVIGEVQVRRHPKQDKGGTRDLTGLMPRVGAKAPDSSDDGGAGREVAVDHQEMTFDRVISIPIAHGPGIGGVLADSREFIVVDEHCRVSARERTWAAGDCTPLSLKHSMLAVAQADAAADSLAAAAGAEVEPAAFVPTLTGVLVEGAAGRWWAETASLPEGVEAATHCLWWPSGKVLGGRLARYVARRDPSARPLLLSHPGGTALQVDLPAPPRTTYAETGLSPEAAGTSDTAGDNLRKDVYARNVFALRRLEREAGERLMHLEDDLEQQHAKSREVLRSLNAAGYLLKEH